MVLHQPSAVLDFHGLPSCNGAIETLDSVVSIADMAESRANISLHALV